MKGPYTLKEAKEEAQRLSTETPKLYYMLNNTFGIYIEEHKRLHVFAPSDSFYPAYWHGGKEKPFTEAQIANDWTHTPTMM